jgi:glycosyltransferase involved in cell wall biosynthesis
VKILMVSFVAPWPEDSGARIRAAQTLRALAAVGEVDLYCILDAQRARHGPPAPPDLEARRVRVRVRPSPPIFRQRVAWLRPGGPPRRIAAWHGDLHVDLAAWAETDYDLTWVVRAPAFAAIGTAPRGPVIVDLDDLGDVLATEEAEMATTRVARWMAQVDARRWGRYQRALAADVLAVGVCSELDRTRAGLPNAVVVPNGYESGSLPDDVGRPTHEPRTLLMQGALVRPPLVDAACALATDILPRVRAALPETRLLLVGPTDPSVRSLGDLPGVEVTGAVPEMVSWLAAADVVAVPMRWGSGTRIKIIEAFAHGIPVVSSTIGAEGLDARDGIHLLIADDPASFADACRRLLTDDELRVRLATAARALYLDRYRWEPIRTEIGDLARRAADGARVGSP